MRSPEALKPRETHRTPDWPGAELSMETIRAYLADLSGRGRRKGTVQMYSAKLRALYDYLPPDKQISRGTLAAWRAFLLPQVTVERVRAGRLPVRTGGERRYVPLPACLQGELLDYARRQGLTAGPVFCTRNGKGMSRTQVTEEIQTLCHDARVEEEKGTPRCLRKLYLATRAEVERGVRLLAEQSYERMLDTEQLAAGWAEGTGHSIHKDVYI